MATCASRSAPWPILVLVAAFIAGSGFLACSGHHPSEPDGPPSRVTDLTAEGIATTALALHWTSPSPFPGDTVVAYDIRFSLAAITADNFETAQRSDNRPRPSSPGKKEYFLLAGLTPSTQYFVSIRSVDNDGEYSDISPCAAATTPAGPDTMPPAAIGDLAATDSTATSITLRWTAVGDDGTAGRVTRYEIRYGADPVTEGDWDEATRAEISVTPGPPFSTQTAVIPGLPIRTTHFFAIRAYDEAGNQSPLGQGVRAGTKIVPMTIHVRLDGSGEVHTISAGVERAFSGDTVLVGPGTYLEHINLSGKTMTLQSESGPAETVIDGQHVSGPVVFVLNTDPTTSFSLTVEGFSITGGTGYKELPAAETRGGGVYFRGGRLILRQNIIFDNQAESYAGGASILAGDNSALSYACVESNEFRNNTSARNAGGVHLAMACTVRGNVFESNHARYDAGAVLAAVGSYDLDLEGNQFLDNLAGDHGGGVYATQGGGNGRLFLKYNLFTRNVAQGSDYGDSGSGGAIYVSECEGTIEHNTIVHNIGNGETACSGGGIALQFTPASLIIRFNILASNTGCGLTCRYNGRGSIGVNLFWSNSPENVGGDVCAVGWGDSAVVADPEFCDPEVGNYAVRATSAARWNGIVLGAHPEAECGSSLGAYSGLGASPGYVITRRPRQRHGAALAP